MSSDGKPELLELRPALYIQNELFVVGKPSSTAEEFQKAFDVVQEQRQRRGVSLYTHVVAIYRLP